MLFDREIGGLAGEQLAEHIGLVMVAVSAASGNYSMDRDVRVNFYGHEGVMDGLISTNDQPDFMDAETVWSFTFSSDNLDWLPGGVVDLSLGRQVVRLEAGKNRQGKWEFMVVSDQTGVAVGSDRAGVAAIHFLHEWQEHHREWEAEEAKRSLQFGDSTVELSMEPLAWRDFPYGSKEERLAEQLVRQRMALMQASGLISIVLGRTQIASLGVLPRRGASKSEDFWKEGPEAVVGRFSHGGEAIIAGLADMTARKLSYFGVPGADLFLRAEMPTNEDVRDENGNRMHSTWVNALVTERTIEISGLFRKRDRKRLSSKWRQGIRVVAVDEVMQKLGGMKLVLPAEVVPGGMVMWGQKLNAAQLGCALVDARVQRELQRQVSDCIYDMPTVGGLGF